MYKYCREVMWSTDDNAFIATVLELPECQANGKTAVEAINNLDIVIEKWIEIAEEMGRAIPEPLHYGAIDLEHVSEDENVPYYDSSSVTWKVQLQPVCQGIILTRSCLRTVIEEGLYLPDVYPGRE